ncbi:MAG: hypothetical protein HN472_09055 [Nitrospina sp.]|jgi:hypothetical protein|nr:hypothetical protein [Nitrospina sp.]MBT3875171.1 hypothetical protein [Nitrospina sp.]MBT4048221.1 hypothetical protein [Nitrospina sp.]MBT4897647.1 hypothetical protein [Nitrospina sp.]MBT6741157.1 hypothetical protein [Nitrospina sp.]
MLSKISYKKLTWIVLIMSIFIFVSNSLLYAEEDMQQGLPSGPGIDLVLGNCTICHSTSIILQNHMDREAWDKTITWMQKEQGMWELEADDRKAILEYLSKHQGINQNMNRNSKRKQSMYEFDYSANPL